MAESVHKTEAKRVMCIFDQGVETVGMDVVGCSGIVSDPPFTGEGKCV